MKNWIIILLLLISSVGYSQKLTIIEQDYEKARKIALKENKLLFIDFYTTWCAPCKKLDKLIFQNDTISAKIGKNFVLLRYDAEQDKTHNLSKKHHVNSYPTGIILNSKGFVLNRKYGFAGDDLKELNKSVFEFITESINLNKRNKILKGYSDKIEISKYPAFYIDFVNRDDKKATSRSDFKEYWNKKHDILSEGYFSTLVYFANKLPTNIADNFLKKKSTYIELYGETDVSVALLFLTFGKFEDAIENKSQSKFDLASKFAKEALEEEHANYNIKMFKEEFDKKKSE
ncbi:thioredoxin family protein [Cellulophaga sp. HaHaR_3_176]|uniref:thioredoxin family protein n=1 Tax=Cellulophaga sp. HaHaR_3_176 TaxID=1942464 RepID=UPI001C1FA365|nr:thioredoxin family protein [Cellulophaga sp. HaHaR_3_176]QWX85410.1 thioredoxin family protein [Cellulophaga sp. HaHaR_3_176]